ncbi:WXG100-like domain-containing protein [Amycolatopsis samaneae]|uniref:Glycosyltransferase n=1 Tax=Amycolatopsis samaneae TaxID=664691 RepID=A0ABW5GRE0_9PSEU
MSLQIPAELTWLVQIVGGDAWPEGDEDKLRVLATAWEEASRELTAVQGEVDSVTAAVLSALQGTASEEFRKFTQAFKAQVPDVAVTAKQLGDLARETALQVEYAKYMIVGTLIMLAMQIAWALANAFWTFGASTATIPAMQAAARTSVQVVLKNLVMAVLFGIVFQVGMDAAIQGIQMLKGDRTKWDADLTKGAAIAGAIGGVIGFGLGAAGKRFAPKFSRSIAGEMTKGGLHEWLTEQVSGVVQGNWNGLNPAAASAGAIEGAVDGFGGRKKRGGGTQAGKNKIANAHIEGIDKLDLSKMPSMTDSPVSETGVKPTRDPGTRTASAQPDPVPSPQRSTSDSVGQADTTTPPAAQGQPVATPSVTPKHPERPASPKTEPAPASPKTQPVSTEPVKPAVTPEQAQPKPTVTHPETHQQATQVKQQPVQPSSSHQSTQSPAATHPQTEPAPKPVRTQHAESTQAVTPPSTTTTPASAAQAPVSAQPAPTTPPASPSAAHQNTAAPQGIPALDGPVKAAPQTPPHGSQLAASTPAPTVTPPVSAEPKPGHPAPQPTPVPVPASATPSLTPSTSDTSTPRPVPPMSRPAPPSPQETSRRYQPTLGPDRHYQPTVVAHPVPPSPNTDLAPVQHTPSPTVDLVTSQELAALAPDWTKPGVGLEFQTFLSVHTGTGDARPKTTVLKDVVRGSDGKDHTLWELTVDNRDKASTKWLGTDGEPIGKSTVLEYVTQPVGTHNHQAVLDRITRFTTILADQLVKNGGQVDIAKVWDAYRDQLKSDGKPRPIADRPDQPTLKVGKPNEAIDIAFQVRPQATFDSSLAALPKVLKEIADTGFGREATAGKHDLQADLKARIAEFDHINIPGDTRGNVKGLASLAHLYLTLDKQGFGLLQMGTVQQKPYHHFMVRRDFHGLWQQLSDPEKVLWQQHVDNLKVSDNQLLYPDNFKESSRVTARAWLDSIADPATVLFPNAKLDNNSTPWVKQIEDVVREEVKGRKTRPDQAITDLLADLKKGNDILGAKVEAAKQHLSLNGQSKIENILDEVREHGKDLVSTLTGEAIGKMPKAADPSRAVTFEWRGMADVPGGQTPSLKRTPAQVTDLRQITGYGIWSERTAKLVGLLPPATDTNRSVPYHPTVAPADHRQYSPTVLPAARPAPLPPVTPPTTSTGPVFSAHQLTATLGKQPTPDHPKLGKDPFGVRRAPEAPDFLGEYDYAKLHAGKRVDFFRKLDLLNPAPESSALRPGRLTEHRDRVTEGALVGRTSGWGVKHQKVPHLVHSIWMGGALFDDGGARQEFRENIARSAQHNPDFDFVVWTDVSRQDVDQARNTREEDRTPRQRDVAEMAHWAEQHDVRLVNLDEVFTAQNPMVFDAEVRTERARGNPAGWASASDLIRLEILNRFGGVYTDGDNTVQPPEPGARSPLSANVEQIAGDKLGFGLSRDRHGRITNSALVAAAGTTAVRRYLDLIGGNLGKSKLELFGLENASEATKHRVNLKENVKDDTIFRTGPHMFTYTELAQQLGITKDQFPQVPDTVVHVESSQSWLGGAAKGPAFDRQTVLDAVKGAVTSLHRELAARPGYLFLAPAARTINRLPEPQREAAWHATLDLVTEVDRNSVRAISAFEIRNARAVEVGVPESVRARLRDDFPAADYVHGTKDGTENADPLVWTQQPDTPQARSAPRKNPGKTGQQPSAPAQVTAPDVSKYYERFAEAPSFAQPLRDYRVTPIVEPRRMGPALGQRDPETPPTGFVATVPATSDINLMDLAERYRQAFGSDRSRRGRFALVIGINGYAGNISATELTRKIEDFRKEWDRKGTFPIVVSGFSWWQRDIANKGFAIDQKTIPYGLIREVLARDPETVELVGQIRDQGVKDVYLHVGDADAHSLNTPNGPLFDAVSKTLKEAEALPEIVSGGYTLPEGTGKEKTARMTAEVDLAVRKAMAKVDPRTVYFPEPNLFLRLDETNSIGFTATFGSGYLEGRTLVESVQQERGFDEPGKALLFDPGLAITTDGGRIAGKVGEGDGARAVIAALSGLTQNHANSGVWADQVAHYLKKYHDEYPAKENLNAFAELVLDRWIRAKLLDDGTAPVEQEEFQQALEKLTLSEKAQKKVGKLAAASTKALEAKIRELTQAASRSAPPPGPTGSVQPSASKPGNDWQHSESATADWAEPKHPLPPSRWESLRDRAPVRTVDYEARDILRSSTPKKPDFIPGLVRYDVRRMEAEPGHWVQEYTLRVRLVPGDGISPSALADARAKALAGVSSLLNRGYRLPSGDQFHVRVEFTDETDAHTTVKLTKTENANQVEWGTETSPTVLAHEIAHYFGLPDEYRDTGDWKRIFNSDGKPLPDGRKPLNAVIEDDGLMGQRVHYSPTLLPRHLWRIEQTMTSQVHLPDASHTLLTSPESAVPVPPELGSPPPARPAPGKTGYELSDRQHTELGRLGHRERWVPADGWCLFHALAATAGERLGDPGWERIRQEVADRVEHATGPEADRYRLLLTPAEGRTAMTPAEAATAIRTDSGYYTTAAGDLAVQAAADRYGVRLSVVNEDGSVTSVGDGHEVVLVRALNERKAAHFWATKPLREPVVETLPVPVVETSTEPVTEAPPEPVVETPPVPVVETPTEPVTATSRTSASGTPPVYLSQGLLGTGQVERVLGHPVSEPDAIAAALADAVTDDLPLAGEKQARQAIADLVERHGPAGAMRRLLAGEHLAAGDTPVRVRLRVTGTEAAATDVATPKAAMTGTVSTVDTTTATGTVNPLSAAVAVTSAVADGHFLTVKPTLKPVDERTRQQATTHTTETAQTVTATGKTGFDVDAVLDVSAGGRTRTTELPSALRVRYPGEAVSVTADRQAVTAPEAVHRVFGVVEDASGLTTIRDALLDRPGIVPGSPLHRAITGRFSVDTPATHGRHLLGGVLTATDGTTGVAVRSTPTHFQRVETSDLTLEQSASSTRKDKTAQAGAFGAEVGVALSYGAPGVKIPSGEVKIAATASASMGPSRSLTTAATIEGAAKTTLKYDGDTVLYRVDTEYAVESTGPDHRETHRGQVYLRVPSWQAAEFEAALRGETVTTAPEAAPLVLADVPTGGTPTALSAVDSVTGLEHVTGRAAGLLDEFFADRTARLGTVKARLAETLSAANLRDSYEQVREGLRVPISLDGRDLTLTVKAYLGEPSAARRIGTVEIASSTGSTGSAESKDTKSSNRGVGLEAAARVGVDRGKPGLLAGLTLGGAAKWQDADSSATSVAAGSTHKLTYAGPGVAVDYPATFEVALAEGNRAKGGYVPGAVRVVLPEPDCLPPAFAAIPAAANALSPTGAVSLPPGSALPGRLDHVDKVNAAIARALAVTREGVGAWRGLTPLTVPTSVAHAGFDRMLNGGLDLQLLAPGTVHRRTDAVRVELELRHPKLVADGEGVTSETQHTSSVSTESGHSRSWGVEGYAQAGAGVAVGVRKGVGGEEGTTDSVGGKNTSTIKRSGAHLKYRADAVYWVTAYSWQDGLGASGHPATHRIPVAVPDGVEYWMPKDRAEKANLPVAEPVSSTVDDKRWYLPEHIGKSLGNAAVDEVSPAARILPEAQRLLTRHAPEFAPHSRDTGAPTGVIPALRAAFSPSDVKAALRRAAATGQSVVVHRSTWRGLRQLEIRVAARLDTANARSAGPERIAVDSTAEGSSAHATSKTTNSTIAATLDAMAPKVQADPASAVSGVPSGGLLAGRQTGGTESTGHTVKNTDKIKGGERSVRFEVPVEYVVEIFRDGNRVDGTTLRDGTASLLVPEELCPTTEPAGAVASHPGAVDLRGARVLAEAMPGGPELAAALRHLITDSANEVAVFRADGVTKLVAEGRHGGQKTAVFTDEDLRIGNFGRLLDGIGQTVVDNDAATTTGYRFGMRLEVVAPELLGTVELTTEQARKIAVETGTASQATTMGTVSLGGTAQGTTGPGTTGGTPGTAATAKKSTAAQTTGTGTREETVTGGGTHYRYRATARYDLSVSREQGNVLDRRFGTGSVHRVVTLPDGVYFLVPQAEAERLKLPLPGQPPAARSAPAGQSTPAEQPTPAARSATEPEAPADRELPREAEDVARPWHELSTVEALKLAANASSATHEEEDEDDVRITPPPSITRPKGRA